MREILFLIEMTAGTKCCSKFFELGSLPFFFVLFSLLDFVLFSRTTICNLYTMPRIGEPVWLTMMSGTPEKNQLCHRFMKEFTFLMENASKNQYGGL